MKRGIKEAFDTIQLSETSKDRILEDIMDSQRKGYRTVLKRIRTRKWRAIPVALMVVVVIAVGTFVGMKALGGNNTPSVATEPTGNISTAPVEPTYHISSIDIIDFEQEYADVPEHLRDHVMLYAEALYENWPKEDWERLGLCMELYQVKDHVDCGFVLKDLDHDGLDDLLLYGGSQLYDILVVNFWPVDTAMGLPSRTHWRLTHEEDESRMFLCEDNVIMHTYVLNDGDEYFDYCRLGKNSSGLSCLETIETVFAIDGTEWFAGPNNKDAAPISAEEADNIIAGYQAEEVEPRIFYRKEAYVVNYQHQFDGVDERYKPLLMTYGKALCEDWPQARWEEADLSPYIYLFKEEVAFSYTLTDLDGNGENELLIFGGNYLYALYILRDDQPVERLQWKIHQDAVPVGMQLCEGNIVKIPQSEIVGSNYVSFYRLGKDGLGAVDLVMVDTAFQTTDGQWYAGPNEKDAVEVTEKEALAMIESFLPMDIDATPIGNNLRLD